MTECRIAGCPHEAVVKGLCNACYAKILTLYENRHRDREQQSNTPRSPRAQLQRSKTDNASTASSKRGIPSDANRSNNSSANHSAQQAESKQCYELTGNDNNNDILPQPFTPILSEALLNADESDRVPPPTATYTARVPIRRAQPAPIETQQTINSAIVKENTSASNASSMGMEQSSMTASPLSLQQPTTTAFQPIFSSPLSPRAALLPGSHRGAPTTEAPNENNNNNNNNNNNATNPLLSPRSNLVQSGFLLPALPASPMNPPLSPREGRLRTVSANAEGGNNKRSDAMERVSERETERLVDRNPPLLSPRLQQHANTNLASSSSSQSATTSTTQQQPSVNSLSTSSGAKRHLGQSQSDFRPVSANARLVTSPQQPGERENEKKESSQPSPPLLSSFRPLSARTELVPPRQNASDQQQPLLVSQAIPSMPNPNCVRSPPLSPRTRAASGDIGSAKRGEATLLQPEQKQQEQQQQQQQQQDSFRALRSIQISQQSSVERARLLSQSVPALAEYRGTSVATASVPNHVNSNTSPRTHGVYHFDSTRVSKEALFLLTQILSRHASEGVVAGVMKTVLHCPFVVYHFFFFCFLFFGFFFFFFFSFFFFFFFFFFFRLSS
jgi:hypothetical protein